MGAELSITGRLYNILFPGMRSIVVLVLLFCSMMHRAAGQRATDTFRLYFDLNVPKLNSATEKKIDLLIYNDKLITGSEVMIIGYADFLGSEGYNKDLSMQRANNVKEYLVTYGLNAKDIKVCLGRGKIEREGMTTKKGYAADRRVDIVVNNAPNKPVPPEKGNIRRKRPRIDSPKKVVVSTIEDIKKLKPGDVFQLKNVYFPSDRHFLRPESYVTLEKLYTVLKDNPNIRISIEGHVCCIAPDKPDAWDIDTGELSLSVNRAKAIYNYLVGKGIVPERLQYTGFGKRMPVVAEERTEEDKERNRRVEVRLLAK